MERLIIADISLKKRKLYELFKYYRYWINMYPLNELPRLTIDNVFIPPEIKKDNAKASLNRRKNETNVENIGYFISEGMKVLNDMERRIIYMNYLTLENERDYSIYTRLNIGRSKYYVLKKEAVNKLADQLENYKKYTTKKS
ncbi:ArpU family phage packaging/lysis transcriptional regulator [Staphylococcus xylosus]